MRFEDYVCHGQVLMQLLHEKDQQGQVISQSMRKVEEPVVISRSEEVNLLTTSRKGPAQQALADAAANAIANKISLANEEEFPSLSTVSSMSNQSLKKLSRSGGSHQTTSAKSSSSSWVSIASPTSAFHQASLKKTH
jgi:hypothetical protein